MNLIDLHDAKQYEHSCNVSTISGMLAEKAGYGKSEARLIRDAALYHDIGKAHIPDSILDKPGKLTPDEFAVVKNHTTIAHDQIRKAARMLAAADIIAKYHHERLDGTGYHGLAGNDIHHYARLVAVADVLDALLSQRPYKPAWSMDQALAYLRSNAGTQFDQRYVGLLAQMETELKNLYMKKG